MLKFIKPYLNHYASSYKNKFFKPLSYLEYMGIYYQHGIKVSLKNIVKSNFLISRAITNNFNNDKENKILCNCSSSNGRPLQECTKYMVHPTSDCNKSKLLNCNFLRYGVTCLQRLYSTSHEPSTEIKKHLMDFPIIVWPSFLQTIRNGIFIFFIVKPYYEPDFTLQCFTKASKQALAKVSEILSRGDFNSLKEFVEENALEEIKRNFALFNFKERIDLATKLEDIFFSFPYQVGIIFKKDEGATTDRVFLEITMCFHLFRGLTDFLEKAESAGEMKRSVYDNEDRISIANYRFIKEITRGSEDQWTINVLNHFKPVKLGPRF